MRLAVHWGTALVVLAAVACGSAGDHPLGGAHGGTVASVPHPGASAAPTATASTAQGDASTPPPNPSGCNPSAAPATAPTFTQLYTKYFAPGAAVDCATGATCHGEFNTVQGGWQYLVKNQMVGMTPPALTDPNLSCLTWYGGNMPETGTTCNPQAVADLNAWATAGGKDN
jgi:hypothetical protein